MLINNSTITENRVLGLGYVGGGGIANIFGSLTINNSTISDNDSGEGGGGIWVFHGTVIVNHSTVVNNDADFANGIGTEQASLAILRSSIIANMDVINCDGLGQFVSLGHNLSSTDDCNLTGPGDLPNTDPLLGPLQDNGSSTPTHALMPGSPAIDAALNCPPTDQRGVARPQGPRCDIGAFEAVYETMALAHQYWMNDGSTGQGRYTLFADGSFLDEASGGGSWDAPAPDKLWLAYNAGYACDALLLGSVLPPDQVRGLRLCRDGSGARGVW